MDVPKKFTKMVLYFKHLTNICKIESVITIKLIKNISYARNTSTRQNALGGL